MDSSRDIIARVLNLVSDRLFRSYSTMSQTLHATPLPMLTRSESGTSSSRYTGAGTPASSTSSATDVEDSFQKSRSPSPRSCGRPLPTLEEPSPSAAPRCDTLIFDLGDVLFTWSAETKTTISPKLLHKILRSATWFAYEKGDLGEEECYALVANEFGVPASEVAAAFQGARDSLKGSPDMINLIRALKLASPHLRVFAMSNISAPDWAVLRGKAPAEEWALFDRVFTSAEARERKPNLGFYRHVLATTGVDPLQAAFVDDKLENVLSARSVGLHGVVFDSFESVSKQLWNLVSDPRERALRYLDANAKRLDSVTDTGIVLRENFAQLLILEATGNRELVNYVEHPRLFNFFQGEGVFTTAQFPCDLDTTSIGLTVAPHIDDATKRSVMDEMVTYLNKDGIIQTYFDRSRPRIDPIVCINVLTLFHSNGRGDELAATLDWVYDNLQHHAYKDGTYYYYGPDTFLFFLSRLMSVSPTVHARFAPLFSRRVLERFGAEGDAMALAMRIIAASKVQFCDTVDYQRLLDMQEVDGSWPVGWVYKYGGADIVIGNKGLTTALAIEAVEAVRSLHAVL
ncbi:HAD-like protein [Punctularia strigosozonata HHB-11173 SS5]|uniref:HAD-like protein n=1 Tax=Punctularia strigosozonata (strain HHB-11173) TaxID=741275 RepID=UPI000441694A|nr:HAD-like protein [Punctularia strigosozonata HHB-11173 SS5]EIN08974.1 HAD-like protein [Punctularia strigosozonata HHB-11173 SS5]